MTMAKEFREMIGCELVELEFLDHPDSFDGRLRGSLRERAGVRGRDRAIMVMI